MTDYNICEGMPAVEVLHLGKRVAIRREENPAAVIRADYAATARSSLLHPADAIVRGR